MRFSLLLLVVVSLIAWPAPAQEPAQQPAHISFVEGAATIDHDGESEPAALNIPVVQGDHIRTANGRVSVMFPDGSSIDIDPYSDVEFLTNTRVRVVAGAIEHRAAEPVDPRSPSTQYLPPDLQAYGPDLDRAGSWQYEAQYGNVWYPVVASDWRPYYDGYWAPVPAYGLTWIGYDRWSWPTHHYGRWGYARSRWFWIPGRSWSTAWVSWGTGPDYIGWCPLGYDSRPIVALSVGYRSSWNAWTIMRRDQFGSYRYPARRYGIEPYRIASTTPFIEHRRPPTLSSTGRVSVAGVDQRAVRGDRVGVAVPRYSPSLGDRASYGPASGRRDDAPSLRDRGSVGEAGGRRDDGRRATSEPIIVGSRPAAPTTNDSRAYRPRYEPQYAPTYTPPQAYPRANDRGQVSRDRRGDSGNNNVQQAPRYDPPAPRYETPAPRYQRAPANEQRGPSHEQRAQPRESAPPPPPARTGNSNGSGAGAGIQGAPHSNGGDHGGDRGRARPEGSQTTGTAVRRPR